MIRAVLAGQAALAMLGACGGAPHEVSAARAGAAPLSLAADARMVAIPAGRYILGSTPEERAAAFDDYAATAHAATPETRPPFDSEADRHNAMLPAFRVDLMPVTQAAFAEFVIETRAAVPTVDPADAASPEVARFAWSGGRPPGGREDHPVVLVTWSDAEHYCAWRGELRGVPRRLPTADELEKAARGDNGFAYPWGNLFEADKLDSAVGGPGDTTPVGSYTTGASPYGVLDLAGNVLQWTATPAPDGEMMVTGSAWDEAAGFGRGASRHHRARTARTIQLGFRCAADAGVD